MHPAPLETSTDSSVQSSILSSPSPSQHGHHVDSLSTPSPSLRGDDGIADGSTSEWSLSPTGSGSPNEGYDTWLSPSKWDAHQSRAHLLDHDGDHSSESRTYPEHSPLQLFPEEMLFQIVSHLSETELLTLKLVSRRFYDLVNSPHAWMNAFSRFFPGPESLRATAEVIRPVPDHGVPRAEKPAFARLTSTTSWSGEYLRRTKLLRCITRGKPALPFAYPAPGNPDKGMATVTFSTRLGLETSNLHADWGQTLDKRKPQFISGFSGTGKVASSDRKGKFDSWGISDGNLFRSFAAEHPGTALYGGAQAAFVGIPNQMDLSQIHGMVHAEGTPGGNTFFLGHDEKRGRNLASFVSSSNQNVDRPHVNHAHQCTCSVWIAKSPAVPHVTFGVVGLLSGSSCGVMSAYSLGPSARRDQRFERGELTARWLLSPGVPIIALAVDENLTESRVHDERIWAVALNALGEVFYLVKQPVLPAGTGHNPDPSDGEKLVAWREERAWATGSACPWQLVPRTFRHVKQSMLYDQDAPAFLPRTFWTKQHLHVEKELRDVQYWLEATPATMQSSFNGWNMQRRLEVDFGGDDGRCAGEHVAVVDSGSLFNGSEMDLPAKISRYSRCNLTQPPGRAYEWRESQFSFSKYKSIVVNATALDQSKYATTNAAEDAALEEARNSTREIPTNENDSSVLKMPGKRARLFAAGTAAGSVFVWNMRATVPGTIALIQSIEPVRIIHTPSPGVTSLALSSLILVHGGAEGLIQAWDPLGSTLEPLRTLTSQYSMNNRRRLVIAARQNPALHLGRSDPSHFAATNICLDPDPTVLRGVAAVGGFLRYWSYSSASPSENLSKTQKRRLKRGSRNLNASPGENFVGFRRAGLKGFVDQELRARDVEQKEQKAYEREQRRVAGRFGLNLLGEDASDEQLLAYAKLLSEEEDQKRAQRETQETLSADASQEDIEAHLSTLSEEDRQRWKFASWEERREIASASSQFSSIPATPSRAPHVSTDAPAPNDGSGDDELSKAIELSLRDADADADPSHTPRAAIPEASTAAPPRSPGDSDLAEAIRQSLAAAAGVHHTSPTAHATAVSASPPTRRAGEDDDLARAIRLSLEDSSASASASPAASSVASPRLLHTPARAAGGARHVSVSLHDEDEFPSLSSSSPPVGSPPGGASGWGKGKGKRRM